MSSLKELLVDELRDLYSAEQQLSESPPKNGEGSGPIPNSRTVLPPISNKPRDMSSASKEAFDKLGESATANEPARRCRDWWRRAPKPIGASMPRIPFATLPDRRRAAGSEHYEMAAYGTVRTFARTIGENEVAGLLQETLDEEAETDRKLTALAESVNQEANLGHDKAGHKVAPNSPRAR